MEFYIGQGGAYIIFAYIALVTCGVTFSFIYCIDPCVLPGRVVYIQIIFPIVLRTTGINEYVSYLTPL